MITAPLTLQRKLVRRVLTTGVLVGGFAILLLFVDESRRSQRDATSHLGTVGAIIATHAAALDRNDPRLAQELLKGLRAESGISMAALYDKAGRLSATYPPEVPASDFPSEQPVDGMVSTSSHITLIEPIVGEGNRIGTLFLRSDLNGVRRRLPVYGVILLGVVAGSALLAYFFSLFFRRSISEPVLAMIGAARLVREKKDYSVCVAPSGAGELSALTHAFNGMLEQTEHDLVASHESDRLLRVNIDNLKEAEGAARSRELQLQAVTDHAEILLAQLDREHRFKFVSRAFAERYRRVPHELAGVHIAEIIGAKAYESFRDRITSTLAGRREEFEVEVPYADLGQRWVHVVCAPERDADNGVVGLVAVWTDITRRRSVEKELERGRDEALAESRAKDDFLAVLSHELRTPLGPVLLLASEAALNPALSPAVREDFETIRKNVEYEARLMDDLLDLTTITRGKLALELRPIDAHAALGDALATVQAEIDAKPITLTQNLGVIDAAVLGDPVRLQQVFWNVLKNAVKFTPPGGRIMLSTRNTMHGDAFELTVSDTGIGMTPGEMGRIFEAFAQGDHAAGAGSHRFGGLGLGLAISQKLVQLHGGRITVASGGRDLGSTFVVEIPFVLPSPGGVRQPAEEAAPPRLTAEPFLGEPGARGTILLVEDHAPTRTAVEQLLRRRHYRVITAGSIAEARAAAELETITLVISDIGLPDGTGHELMAYLRQRFGLKGIALTGYGMEGDITQSQVAGFMIHLIKPVSMQSLDDALLMIEQWPGPV